MKVSTGNGRNAAGFLIVLLVGLILAGCSQREPLAENASADQHLPFEAASEKSGISPTGSLAPAAVPAGTPHHSSAVVFVERQLAYGRSLRGSAGRAHRAPRAHPGATRSDPDREGPRSPRFGPVSRSGLSAPGSDCNIPQRQAGSHTNSSIFMKRGSHEQRNATVIRDGAGNKGALIGASIDVPGTTYATGSSDVGVAPERHLTFRLAQPLPLEKTETSDNSAILCRLTTACS